MRRSATAAPSRAARRRGGRNRSQPAAAPAAPAAPPLRSHQEASGLSFYPSPSESVDEGDDEDEDGAFRYYQENIGWTMPPVNNRAYQRHEREIEQQHRDYERLQRQQWGGGSDDDDSGESAYEDAYDVDDEYDSDDDLYGDYVTHYANGEGFMFPTAPRSRAGRPNNNTNNQCSTSNNGNHRAPPAEPAAAAQSKPPPPPPVLCRFYVLGKCRYGSHCTYSHSIPAPSEDCEMTEEDSLTAAAAFVDCPYFLRGNCKYGQYCRLRHTAAAGGAARGGAAQQIQSSSTSATTTASASSSAAAATTNQATNDNNPEQEYMCGICFDDIVDSGKHFGLLSCDHCYCLDCLRSWRQSKDMEAEVTRSCPACRLPSNYIVPSLTFCTGEAKQRVVDAYKSHLSVRECKYFNGLFGSCPFGQHCFYAHRNSEGQDVKHLDRPRRSAKDRNNNRGGSGNNGGLPSNESLSSLLSNYGSLFRFLESLDWDEYGDAFEMDSEWD